MTDIEVSLAIGRSKGFLGTIKSRHKEKYAFFTSFDDNLHQSVRKAIDYVNELQIQCEGIFHELVEDRKVQEFSDKYDIYPRNSAGPCWHSLLYKSVREHGSSFTMIKVRKFEQIVEAYRDYKKEK